MYYKVLLDTNKNNSKTALQGLAVMASQFSTRSFFRNTPNRFLIQYFEAKQVYLEVDWPEINESAAAVIQDAFNQVDEALKSEVEADFQDMNALACEGGAKALADEADFHQDSTFIQTIAAIESFHGKAMYAFLNKPEYWEGATVFLHADNVGAGSWKKRNDFNHDKPCVEPEDIAEFKTEISQYFYGKEGRGKHCEVEVYRRHNKEYFFAYPEDFAQSAVEWQNGKLENQARHPAFEIIFVYCESESSLDIYARKNTDKILDLQAAFAKSILKIDGLTKAKPDSRVYELAPVTEPDFEFKVNEASGIMAVVVTRLRVRLNHGDNRRITVEATTKNNASAVYELLKELSLPPHQIINVGLKVSFAATASRRAYSKPVNISYPNACNLNHDGNDLKIRQMLVDSGIEPKAITVET